MCDDEVASEQPRPTVGSSVLQQILEPLVWRPLLHLMLKVGWVFSSPFAFVEILNSRDSASEINDS